MVAEIEHLKALALVEQMNDGRAAPQESVAKTIVIRHFRLASIGHEKHKLKSAVEAEKLNRIFRVDERLADGSTRPHFTQTRRFEVTIQVMHRALKKHRSLI
jgi:hypothetical protein